MRRSVLILTIVLTAALVAHRSAPVAVLPAAAVPRSAPPAAYGLYAVAAGEPVVLRKHDFINVVLRQEAQAPGAGIGGRPQQWHADAGVDSFVKFRLASLYLDRLAGGNGPGVKRDGRRPFDRAGEAGPIDAMSTPLGAEVTGVNANGTLVLEARREVKIDGEDVRLTLTGACHVQDVDETRSVLSTDMHDLKLTTATTGDVRDATRRGQLHQALNLANPF